MNKSKIEEGMHKILYLRARTLRQLGTLIQALHGYFSNEKKQHKKNIIGISLPEINEVDSGTLVGVHFLQTPESLLYYKPIMQLIASHRVSISNIIELNPFDCDSHIAFIRDRRLERGAPPRAIARMQKRITEQEAQWQMQRYFEEHLPKIYMLSSESNRKFTLHIGTLHSEIATPQEEIEFNSYGLSSYRNPIYLPVPKSISNN